MSFVSFKKINISHYNIIIYIIIIIIMIICIISVINYIQIYVINQGVYLIDSFIK